MITETSVLVPETDSSKHLAVAETMVSDLSQEYASRGEPADSSPVVTGEVSAPVPSPVIGRPIEVSHHLAVVVHGEEDEFKDNLPRETLQKCLIGALSADTAHVDRWIQTMSSRSQAAVISAHRSECDLFCTSRCTPTARDELDHVRCAFVAGLQEAAAPFSLPSDGLPACIAVVNLGGFRLLQYSSSDLLIAAYVGAHVARDDRARAIDVALSRVGLMVSRRRAALQSVTRSEGCLVLYYSCPKGQPLNKRLWELRWVERSASEATSGTQAYDVRDNVIVLTSEEPHAFVCSATSSARGAQARPELAMCLSRAWCTHGLDAPTLGDEPLSHAEARDLRKRNEVLHELLRRKSDAADAVAAANEAVAVAASDLAKDHAKEIDGLQARLSAGDEAYRRVCSEKSALELVAQEGRGLSKDERKAHSKVLERMRDLAGKRDAAIEQGEKKRALLTGERDAARSELRENSIKMTGMREHHAAVERDMVGCNEQLQLTTAQVELSVSSSTDEIARMRKEGEELRQQLAGARTQLRTFEVQCQDERTALCQQLEGALIQQRALEEQCRRHRATTARHENEQMTAALEGAERQRLAVRSAAELACSSAGPKEHPPRPRPLLPRSTPPKGGHVIVYDEASMSSPPLLPRTSVACTQTDEIGLGPLTERHSGPAQHPGERPLSEATAIALARSIESCAAQVSAVATFYQRGIEAAPASGACAPQNGLGEYAYQPTGAAYYPPLPHSVYGYTTNGFVCAPECGNGMRMGGGGGRFFSQ